MRLFKAGIVGDGVSMWHGKMLDFSFAVVDVFKGRNKERMEFFIIELYLTTYTSIFRIFVLLLTSNGYGYSTYVLL